MRDGIIDAVRTFRADPEVRAVLLKLFVNCVGIIPIGSLVMLETKELAVVLKPVG